LEYFDSFLESILQFFAVFLIISPSLAVDAYDSYTGTKRFNVRNILISKDFHIIKKTDFDLCFIKEKPAFDYNKSNLFVV